MHCMASHGNPWGSWQSMALHTLHGSLGLSTQQEVVSSSWAMSESTSNEYRPSWMPMAVHRSPWQSMGPLAVHGSSPWQPLAAHCTPWQSMVVSHSINKFLLLLAISTALVWVHGSALRPMAVYGVTVRWQSRYSNNNSSSEKLRLIDSTLNW